MTGWNNLPVDVGNSTGVRDFKGNLDVYWRIVEFSKKSNLLGIEPVGDLKFCICAELSHHNALGWNFCNTLTLL